MTSTETAVAAHLNAILRCYTREAAVPVTVGTLRLAVGGSTVTARVEHASRTGWHQFAEIRVDDVPPTPEEFVRLLSLDADPAEVDDLVARTAESVRNVAFFVDAGGADRGPGRFLEIEQALLFGQLNHPAPKSRDGLSGAELARYSPELGGRFAVHWFEADTELVSSDQVAGAPSLQGLDAVQLMGALAGITPSPGRVLIPAHPWQAAALRQRPRVAKLLNDGRVRELGPHGAQWYPTSSLRTLFHPDLPVMLKLSLGLRITDARRESTPTELGRGLEVYRLLDAAYNAGTATTHPRFTIVRDPAWIALDEGGPTLTGLDVAIREVPTDVNSYACLAGLVAPRPDRISRLSEYAADDPIAWLASYLDNVLIPMLHLYAETGIGLEAHQQNTLVRLDGLGRIKGGGYRDNQGYYLAASHLRTLLTVTGLRDSTLAVLDDPTVDDHLTANLLHNQALAVVGCLAADGVADEAALLDVVRARLTLALPLLAAAGPDGDRLPRRWLTAKTLPYQANLSTLHLNVPNPLTA